MSEEKKLTDEVKQILAIAQDIADNCPDMVENCCGSKPCYVCIAEGLAKDHYQKIDKDKVVLTREEWKQIKNSLYYSKEALEKKLQQARKETAKVIFSELYKKKIVSMDMRDNVEYLVFMKDVLELAKQFGVEVDK